MAAPLRNPKYKIPKKEQASKLLRARRLALKAGREASTRFGKSLKQVKASNLLGQLTKGNLNIPYPKGVNPAGITVANRALAPLSKSLLGRAGLAIQGFQTARSVFDPNDNIITSIRNVGRAARDQEALGNSELAKAYNKRRELKIDQSLDQIYKNAPMSDKTVPYPSGSEPSLDQNAVQQAQETAAVEKPIVAPSNNNNDGIRILPLNSQGQIESISQSKLANLDDRSNYTAIEWAGKNQSSARNSVARQKYLKKRKALEIGAQGGLEE